MAVIVSWKLLIILVELINFISSAKTIEIVDKTRFYQTILVGPKNVFTYPQETVQLPCIVSKQKNSVVTWCWNDFCTLGKTQWIRNITTADGIVHVYQYLAYPRFQLHINEQLNHFNLSIVGVTDKDEGIFQCQIQRTMNAHEARSDRVHLTLIAPPSGQPTLVLPNLPLKQGQSANITCLSSPSKPASLLIFYKEDRILTKATSLRVFFELDNEMKKNLTTLIYTIDDPDIHWHNVSIRCEQIFAFDSDFRKSVSTKLQVHYKPKVRIESQNRHALVANSTATFRCIAQGNPTPQFRWFANTLDLTSLTSSTINVPLSKHVHNHSIGCMATNTVGSTNSSIRLLIRYPPTIFVQPAKFVALDLENKASNPLTLRCLVDAYPRPKISWMRHGVVLEEGPTFHLENITKREQQGIYTYRIETDGFETIIKDFIIYIKGKPLIYIHQSRDDYRIFECHIYSSSSIYKVLWKINDETLLSDDRSSISTNCNEYSCISKLRYNYRKMISSTDKLFRLSCAAENEFGLGQSRLYQIDTSEELSLVLIWIVMISFMLIVIFSMIAIYCCCQRRVRSKTKETSNKTKLPMVYDEHYSINELIKEVSSLKTCNTTSSNATDRISLKTEATDQFITNFFTNNNNNSNTTKKLADNFSNGTLTNSSGFHSKSTTTIYNTEYSPTNRDIADLNFSGMSSIYTSQYQMNV